MRQRDPNPSDPQNIEMKLECAAHHEAGHIVIAATQELKLRPQGLIVDFYGNGLACYCKEPDESDLSRERVIIAAFAGFKAQERFCEEHSYPVPHAVGVILSDDWKHARLVICKLSAEYLSDDNAATILPKLENWSAQLIDQNWPAIKALATALLAKDWEPLKPFKSGNKLSDAAMAKCLTGEEIVSLLAKCGIVAACDPDC